MSKNSQKAKAPDYIFEPWSFRSEGDKWLIEAHNLMTGKREIVAEVKESLGFPAENLAQFITDAVNIIDKRECLINEMAAALEICLESEDGKLKWAAEHDAEIALRHATARTRMLGSKFWSGV